MNKHTPRRSLDGIDASRPPRSQSPGPRRQPAPRTQSAAPPSRERLPDLEVYDQPQTARAPRKRRFFNKRRVVATVAGVLSVVILGGGMILWFLQNNMLVANIGGGSSALGEFVDPSSLRGEGDGRVNILLIGIDDAADLSDTIMLASIDPVANDVALLSIPRDLLVNIPGFGSAKINAAHAYGERYEYEGGGPQLLQDTLEEVLDVPMHYYARVNFEGFEQAIDTVGGVEVQVEEELMDNFYPDEETGGYDPFHIAAGPQMLDGDTALKYVRSRYSTSDFDRSRRQQQVLLGLKERALSVGTLSNPSKVGNLLRSLSQNAQTNLNIEEIMRLIEIGEEIDGDRIVRGQLDASEDNFLTFSNYYGQSVLVPTTGNYEQIQEYVRGLLVDSYIKNEAASISVLNGTMRTGLAAEVGELLRSFGYSIDKIDNASEQNYTQTVIFDYSGDNPYTLRYLEQRFGVSAQRREAPNQEDHLDIEIVVGSDYDPVAQ